MQKHIYRALLGLLVAALAGHALPAVPGSLSIQSRSGEPLYAIMDVFEVTQGPVSIELVSGEDPALEGLSAGIMITGAIAKLILTTAEPIESDRLEARVRLRLPDGSVWVRGLDYPLRPRLNL